jgi:hypothetical protein
VKSSWSIAAGLHAGVPNDVGFAAFIMLCLVLLFPAVVAACVQG